MHDILEEVSDLLKLCAHKLLLANHEYADPSIFAAFEKTYEALDTLRGVTIIGTKRYSKHIN